MQGDGQTRLTLADAARRFGHSAVTLRQAVQRGSLRASKAGDGRRATYYTTPMDVEAYLARRRTWKGYAAPKDDDQHDR